MIFLQDTAMLYYRTLYRKDRNLYSMAGLYTVWQNFVQYDRTLFNIVPYTVWQEFIGSLPTLLCSNIWYTVVAAFSRTDFLVFWNKNDLQVNKISPEIQIYHTSQYQNYLWIFLYWNWGQCVCLLICSSVTLSLEATQLVHLQWRDQGFWGSLCCKTILPGPVWLYAGWPDWGTCHSADELLGHNHEGCLGHPLCLPQSCCMVAREWTHQH